MKKLVIGLLVVLLLMVIALPTFAQAGDNACWGQASAVFAQTSEMGEHSSEQETPRMGLRNLARALYDAGVIADDSMQALGRFVAGELGLTIAACVD